VAYDLFATAEGFDKWFCAGGVVIVKENISNIGGMIGAQSEYQSAQH